MVPWQLRGPRYRCWHSGPKDQPGRLSTSRSRPPAITGLPPELAPMALVMPGYVLTERVAWARGLDPDRPAGLDKVTRTT